MTTEQAAVGGTVPGSLGGGDITVSVSDTSIILTVTGSPVILGSREQQDRFGQLYIHACNLADAARAEAARKAGREQRALVNSVQERHPSEETGLVYEEDNGDAD